MLLVMLASCGPQLAVRPAEPATPTALPTRPPYDPSAVRTVERRNLADALLGRATIQPKLTEQLFFRRAGRVSRVDVATGDVVTAGQILARLEQTDLEYQIGLAQLDVDLARLRARAARDKPATPLDVAIADKESARADLALERLKTEQQSLLVTAPYAGRVTDISAKPGSEITAYRPIATIIGSEQLIIVAEFTGPKAARISIGQLLELQDVLDNKLSFKGQVTGKAGPETPNGLIVAPAAGADGPRQKLKLGDIFQAIALLGQADNVLTLPSAAIKTIGDRHYVLLVDHGDLRRVYVEIGIEANGIVEIRSGLQAGQQVSEH